MTKQRTKPNTALWVVLASALALRLALALVTEGYPYDMSCFVAWGDKLAAQGPAAFYSEGYFADYPPGYLWVLGLVGAVRAALGIAYESRWTYLLLALVPSVCDCVSAALVYAVARRGMVGRQMALVLAAFTAFDPLLLFDTAVWKQIDGAFALPLLLCTLMTPAWFIVLRTHSIQHGWFTWRALGLTLFSGMAFLYYSCDIRAVGRRIKR